MTEIKERKSDHNYHASNHFLNFVYTKNNPSCNIPPVTGVELDIEKIDYETLSCIQEKALPTI